MANSRFNGKSPKKKITTKGFYIALCVCLIAVGVASYVTFRSAKPYTQNNSQSSNPNTAMRVESSPIVINNSSTTPPTTSSEIQKQPVVTQPTTSSSTSSKTPVASKPSTTSSAISSAKPVIATTFIAPVPGKQIKGYSETQPQFSKTFNDWRINLSVNLSAQKNASVFSIGDGKVTKVYNDSMLGNVIEIDYGNDIVGKYCGLSNNSAVKEGDSVKQGQTIGSIGEIPCESVDESHLHFEVLKNGKNIDPTTIIGKN